MTMLLNLGHRLLSPMTETVTEVRNVERQMVVVKEEEGVEGRTRTDISLKPEIEDRKCVDRGNERVYVIDPQTAGLHTLGKTTSRRNRKIYIMTRKRRSPSIHRISKSALE
jgi:hypothetical protein